MANRDFCKNLALLCALAGGAGSLCAAPVSAMENNKEVQREQWHEDAISALNKCISTLEKENIPTACAVEDRCYCLRLHYSVIARKDEKTEEEENKHKEAALLLTRWAVQWAKKFNKLNKNYDGFNLESFQKMIKYGVPNYSVALEHIQFIVRSHNGDTKDVDFNKVNQIVDDFKEYSDKLYKFYYNQEPVEIKDNSDKIKEDLITIEEIISRFRKIQEEKKEEESLKEKNSWCVFI